MFLLVQGQPMHADTFPSDLWVAQSELQVGGIPDFQEVSEGFMSDSA